MVVEKIEVTAGQAVDLGKRGVDGLRVERAAAFEKRLLVTEIADVWTSARHDDRVGNQVQMSLDQIAADRRHLRQRARLRLIDPLRASAPEIGEECRPRIFAGPEEDRVR